MNRFLRRWNCCFCKRSLVALGSGCFELNKKALLHTRIKLQPNLQLPSAAVSHNSGRIWKNCSPHLSLRHKNMGKWGRFKHAEVAVSHNIRSVCNDTSDCSLTGGLPGSVQQRCDGCRRNKQTWLLRQCSPQTWQAGPHHIRAATWPAGNSLIRFDAV